MYFDETLVGREIVINESTGETIVVTPEHVTYSENKLASLERKKLFKNGNPDHKQTKEYIIATYLDADAVLKNIPSIVSLVKQHKANTREEKEKKPKEINFDDVRKMDLDLYNPSGYEEAETKFVQSRFQGYKSFYFGDGVVAPNDEFDLLDIIDLEREIEQLKTFIRLNPKKSDEERKLLPVLRKQRSDSLQGLNAKKLQRDNTKKPKDDKGSISDTLNELDNKSVEDLQHEVELEEQEEKIMLNKRKK